MREGILIAADQNAEKLIPWWWNYYSRYNDRPVAIVDFGMSKKQKKWCQRRMQIISYPPEPPFIRKKQEINLQHRDQWVEKFFKRNENCLWDSREAWFKKPKACLLSPFDTTLWLDLDCEACGSLDPIFALQEPGIDLLIRKEAPELVGNELFNSGVMLIRKGSPFLEEWDRLCKVQNESMMGDQEVLTSLILSQKVPFKELSPLFNWLMYQGIQPGILIAHWAGCRGKKYILKFGGFHPLMIENISKSSKKRQAFNSETLL